MRGTERIIAFCRRRAPAPSSAKGKAELPTSRPALVAATGSRGMSRANTLPNKEVPSGHPVGRDCRVDVQEGIVLDDPVFGAPLRLDGVVSYLFERIADDLEARIGPLPAARARKAASLSLTRIPL